MSLDHLSVTTASQLIDDVILACSNSSLAVTIQPGTLCPVHLDSLYPPTTLHHPRGLPRVTLTTLVLALIILATIFGNALVIAAVVLERTLRNFAANYLIASLAVADLLVALLVMPLAAVYEVSERWLLGPVVCDMWTSFDILCCTSSIFHLVAISVDR